jgi:hypothetical protein
MIDIRIICTHDALKLAETLTRLLEAEQHRVGLSYGRQALNALEAAREEKSAVILIWSPDARSQTYMLEWARNIDPHRLVELARTPDCPRVARKAPVVDFVAWRGERGGRCWDALNDRLRGVQRVLEPPKPVSSRAVAAFGLVTAVAMAGAIAERVNSAFEPTQMADGSRVQMLPAPDPDTGVGGPLAAIEPASIDENLNFRFPRQVALIDASSGLTYAELPDIQPLTLRDETLLERLNAFNPLRQLTAMNSGRGDNAN